MGNKRFLSWVLILLLSTWVSEFSANANEVDLSKTQVISSEKIEVSASSSLVSVYLKAFRPNSDIWFTFDFPEGINLSISSGSVEDLNVSGHLVQLKIHTSDFLISSNLPILTIDDATNKTILKLFSAPKDLPEFTFGGDEKEMKKLNYLLTPTVINGSYTLAIQGGKIRYFEKFSSPVIALKEMVDSAHIRFPSGPAKFTYLEKVELSRTFYLPGIWKFLDSNFQEVGEIGQIKLFGQTIYPDGHGVTSSPAGNPVVMSYVSRKVNSSWLDAPYEAPILDCIFSQLSNGRTTKSFSVWDWFDKNRAIFKEILDLGDRLIDITRADRPVDFCHVNSIQFSKSLNSYIVSLRNLDLILVIDSSLKTVTQQLYSPGSRQHYARATSSTQITALGNYTNGKTSKFQTWTKSGANWKLAEINFPYKVAYCGNAQITAKNRIWIAGGCQNFETNSTAGILYNHSGVSITEIGRLMLPNSSGSYRVELFRP